MPDEEQKEDTEDTRDEARESVPESGNRLLLGLKRFWRAIGRQLQRPRHFFRAGLVRMIDAGSSLLQRLRKRAEESGDEETRADEKHAERQNRPEKSPAREGRVKDAEPKEVVPPEPRSPVRSFFIYLLMLLIGAIAGMTFSFALLSTMVFNQAHKIEDQRDEITQLEKQQSRILESEAKYRQENAENQKRLSEIETVLANQNAAKDKESPPPESAARSAVPATGQQPNAKKTGKCNLDASNVDGNLTRCLDEFNRK